MLIFGLIASAFGVDLITAEIQESLSIIFTRDFKSLEVAVKLCDEKSIGLGFYDGTLFGEEDTDLLSSISVFKELRQPDREVTGVNLMMARELPPIWRRVMQHLPKEVDLFALRKYQGGTPMLSDFRYYRGHLAVIQKDMKDWGPENFRDLLQPGYKDRFVWFATVFGLIIAAVGIIGVITSIISTAVAIITLQATWKLIVLAEDG